MHDLVARERWTEWHDHLGTATAWHRRVSRDGSDIRRLHVLSGEHSEYFFRLARLLDIYGYNKGVRVGGADEGGIGSIGQARVVHEMTGAADQGIVFDAWRLSGAVHGHEKSGHRLAGPLFIAERTVRDRGLRPHAGCGTQALFAARRVASFG